MQTIGERLEEARKKKGISIREAAEATKIRGDYLQKFEGNHFDIGLSEIYVRGFLRNYAGFLKIASDRILNDYTALGRGDARSSRPPIREGYGRTGIPAAAADPGEHAATPAPDGSPDSAPGRAAPRKRSSPPSLPTGPDPAVVFKYVKIGGLVVIGLLVLLIMKSLFSGAGPSPSAPVGKSAGGPRAPVLGLTATSSVKVTVRKNDAAGGVLLDETLAAGQSKTVPRTGVVYVEVSRAENLMIEFDGKRENLGKILGNGFQFGALPAPQ